MRPGLVSLLLGLLALPLLYTSAWGMQQLAPPQPNPGLEASLRAADLIADVEILTGGPFRATALIKKCYFPPPVKKDNGPPTPDEVIELIGFNSINGDVLHNGFLAGTRFVLFLSATGEVGVYSTLTPNAPRLAVREAQVVLALGDPPLAVPVKRDFFDRALRLLLATRSNGPGTTNATGFLRELWEQPDVEPRYLAVTMAGWLGDAGAVEMLSQASKASLLKLRIFTAEALGRIGTSEARGVLRGMLKDEKESVARAAALALATHPSSGRVEALEDLLAWAVKAGPEQLTLPDNDPRHIKYKEAVAQILLLADDAGALLSPENIAPALLELGRSPEAFGAGNALYILGGLARKPQLERLMEAAEDPVFTQRLAAKQALFRGTLRSEVMQDTSAFSAWWKSSREKLELEDARSAQVKGAAAALAGAEAPSSAKMVLRAAPAALTFMALGPLWFNTDSNLKESEETPLFTDDLRFWRSPLALPYLLERLGSRRSSDQVDALQGLTLLGRRQWRWRKLAQPFVRALLLSPESRLRSHAAAAAGVFRDGQALPALLLGLDPNGDASAALDQAVHELSARTLGYGLNEPLSVMDAGARRLNAWWEARKAEDYQAPFSAPSPGPDQLMRAEPAWREQLEAILSKGSTAREYEAALGEMLDLAPPQDPFWRKLLAQPSSRAQAAAMLGLCGGSDAAAEPLAEFLNPERPVPEFLRALTLLALGSLDGIKGGKILAAWLHRHKPPSDSTAGAADVFSGPRWRRLAWLALGLCSDEASRVALAGALTEPPESREQLAVQVALLARPDMAAKLGTLLDFPTESARPWAMRAAALHWKELSPEIRAAVWNALSKIDLYEIAGITCRFKRLASQADVPALQILLESSVAGRISASTVLAARPDLCTHEKTLFLLRSALEDTNTTVKARAAEALGWLHDVNSIEALNTIAQGYSAEAAAQAGLALARIGSPQALQAASLAVARQIRIDSRWARVLGATTVLEDGNLALDVLLKFTRSDLPVERRLGVEGLSFCRRSEGLQRLVELYRENDSVLQSLAGDSLVDLYQLSATRGGKKLLGAYLKALQPDLDSADWHACARAIALLQRLKSPEAKEELERFKNAAQPEIRALAWRE